MPTENNEGRYQQKTRSKDAIIAAIAVVLAAVIGAAGTIIAATNRAKDTLEQRAAALQEELAVKSREAKSLASNMAELKKQVSDMRAQLINERTDKDQDSQDPQNPTGEPPSAVSTRDEIDSFLITITRVRLSGNMLSFDFDVVNKAPADRYLQLFGAGSFGNGNSRFLADGEEYDATTVRVGNSTRDGIVGKKLVSGIPLKGTLGFKGVPQTLKSVAILEFAYSYDNLSPSGAFRFTNLSVSQ